MSYWECVALYWAWAMLLARLLLWLTLAASRERAAASRHRTHVIQGARLAGARPHEVNITSDGYAGGFPSDRFVEELYRQSERRRA